MAIATVAQFAFGAMALSIREDLNVSRTQLGGLTTALFAAGALLSPWSQIGFLPGRRGLPVDGRGGRVAASECSR